MAQNDICNLEGKYDKLKAELALLGFAADTKINEKNGQTVYRVYVGHYAEKQAALDGKKTPLNFFGGLFKPSSGLFPRNLYP